MKIPDGLKMWWSNNDKEKQRLHVELSFPTAEVEINYKIWSELGDKIVSKIAEKYIAENEAAIVRDIITNQKFADAVYNAIVLKVAAKQISEQPK